MAHQGKRGWAEGLWIRGRQWPHVCMNPCSAALASYSLSANCRAVAACRVRGCGWRGGDMVSRGRVVIGCDAHLYRAQPLDGLRGWGEAVFLAALPLPVAFPPPPEPVYFVPNPDVSAPPKLQRFWEISFKFGVCT